MEFIAASNNAGKIREIKEILKPLGYSVLSQREAGLELEVEETGTTFEENALLKAREVYRLTGRPCLADDSGLEVDALGGLPGVQSHRWAGPDADDAARCAKLLKELEGIPEEKRTARFVCVLQYLDEQGTARSFRGQCEGSIGFAPKGENGFGYDPVFFVGGRSFAELSAEEKDRISHRGRALQQWREALAAESGKGSGNLE